MHKKTGIELLNTGFFMGKTTLDNHFKQSFQAIISSNHDKP